MRYMLLLHGREEEVHAAPPERVEEITAFLARFEDELMSGSELDWTEVLASEVNALVVGPDGAARETWLNAEGLPSSACGWCGWPIPTAPGRSPRASPPASARRSSCGSACPRRSAPELRSTIGGADPPLSPTASPAVGLTRAALVRRFISEVMNQRGE